jgi:hypothetical protein
MAKDLLDRASWFTPPVEQAAIVFWNDQVSGKPGRGYMTYLFID